MVSIGIFSNYVVPSAMKLCSQRFKYFIAILCVIKFATLIRCEPDTYCEFGLGPYALPECKIAKSCHGITCKKGGIALSVEFDCNHYSYFIIDVNNNKLHLPFDGNSTIYRSFISFFLTANVLSNNSLYINFTMYTFTYFCKNISCYKMIMQRLIPSNLQAVCKIITYSHMRNLRNRLDSTSVVKDNSINLKSVLEMADLYQRGLVDDPDDRLGSYDENILFSQYIDTYSDIALNASAPTKGIERRIIVPHNNESIKIDVNIFKIEGSLSNRNFKLKLIALCCVIMLAIGFVLVALFNYY